MMRLHTNILPWVALFGLSILPIFRLFTLTWPELLRLLFITAGMFYVYRRIREADRSSPSKGVPPDRYPVLSIFMALVTIFLIIQFDPFSSSFNNTPPKSRWNWFFVSSTGCILLASIFFLMQRIPSLAKKASQRRRSIRSTPFPDTIVVVGGVGAIALSLISKSIFNTEGGAWTTYLGEVKIGECLVLWFIVTRTVSNHLRPISDSSISRRSVRRLPGMLLKFISFIFMVIIMGGGVQSALAFYYFNLGHSFYGRDQLQVAKKTYRQAYRMSHLLHFTSLQDDCLRKLAVIYLREDSTAQAEKILDGFKARKDGFASTQKKMGDVYFETENWAEAKRYYMRFLRSKQRDERVVNNVAWSHIKLNDLQGLSNFVSRYDYEFHFDSVDCQSALVLGTYSVTRGQYEEALRHFQKAEEFDPYRIEVQYWLGLTLLRLSRWEESVERLKKVVKRKPNLGRAHYLLAFGLEMMGQTEEAMRGYEKVIEMQPTHSNALIALELLLRKKNILDRAQDLHHREHVIYASEMEGVAHPFRIGEVSMKTNFALSKMVRLLGGKTVFRVIAKGTSKFQKQPDEVPNFDPSAHMVVRLDEVTLGEADVPLGEWTAFSFEAYADSGQHGFMIEFTNDIHKPAQKKDRNLVIDRVVIQSERL